MMKEEFDTMMNESQGFTFPLEYYHRVIEPVYRITGDNKEMFVRFCAQKDHDGMLRILRNREIVINYVSIGMNIFQINKVLFDFEDLKKEINFLKKENEIMLDFSKNICLLLMSE